MGRLDKLKRQAILEANQRVLGIIKEDKVEDLLGIQDDIDDGVRELENVWNLDDAANQIDHYKEDHDEEENENLDDAMWKLDAAQSAIRDAKSGADDAADLIQDEIDEIEGGKEEEEKDVPVGKSDMDKHLRSKDGGMGVLEEDYIGTFGPDDNTLPWMNKKNRRNPPIEDYEDDEETFDTFDDWRGSSYYNDPESRWDINRGGYDDTNKHYFDIHREKFGPFRIRKSIS